MKVLTLLISLLSCTSYASLSSLTSEYLRDGADNQSLEMGLEVDSLESERAFNSRAWQLSASGENTVSKLERSSSLLISNAALLPNNTETTTYNLSLSKEFVTGTKVGISNTLVSYVNNANTVHNNKGFSQRLSLEQDLWQNFLGRVDSLSLDIAENTFKYKKESLKYEIESNLLGLTTDYLRAKLSKANVQLKEEALRRSNKRLGLIRRRVRDGLSERVDLYSAQSQELASKESLKSEVISFQTNLEELSKKLHRKVEASEVLAYAFNLDSEIHKVDGKIEDNKDLLRAKKQIEYLQKEALKADYNKYPSLVFGGSYSTNNYENDDSPVSSGVIGSENNEVTLGLTLTWNIGSEAAITGSKIASIELNKARMISRKVLQSLKEEEQSLLRRQAEVRELIVSASKRLELSNRTLKEYNLLYSRGRATLDQVIRAEEELIRTQQSYIDYLSLKDSYRSTLSFLKGKLSEAIL